MFYCEDSVHVDGGTPEYIFDYRRPQNDPSLGIPHAEEYASNRKWNIVLQMYSDMDLSAPSDKLPAISAAAETFGTQFSSSLSLPHSYNAGLWKQHFPLNLLWFTLAYGTPKPLVYRAPSWSWAAIDSVIYYHAWNTIHLGRIAVTTTTCETQLASPAAPFGQVTDGYLEIEAPLAELTFRYKPNTIHFDIFGGIWTEFVFDAPRATPSAGQDPYEMITVSLLCIVREARTHEEKEFAQRARSAPATYMQGLILEKTSEENIYTRVGRFTLKWNESLKEVQEWKDWKDSLQMTKVTII
jgi:hypothetical protein